MPVPVEAEVIALAESDEYPWKGSLPDGTRYIAKVRVTRPHGLVMLKLLVLYDRYHNIRGLRKQDTIAKKPRRTRPIS